MPQRIIVEITCDECGFKVDTSPRVVSYGLIDNAPTFSFRNEFDEWEYTGFKWCCPKCKRNTEPTKRQCDTRNENGVTEDGLVDLALMAAEIHHNATKKGFWDNNRSDAEAIALMHSELSEALEELRNGSKAHHYHITTTKRKPAGWLVELGDCIIRMLDFVASKGEHEGLLKAIEEKIAYNRTRPYKHGKEF